MDYDSCINCLIPLIFILAGLFKTAEYSLTKFKTDCDENSIQSKNIFFRKAMDISNNIRDFRITFLLIHFFLLVMFGWTISRIIINREIVELDLYKSLQNYISPEILLIIISIFIVVPIFIFISEILPKYLTGKHKANFAVWSVIPVVTFHLLLFPFRIIIIILEKIFEKIFKNASVSSYLNSEEELRILIEESTKAGTIEENESMLIDNIFEFKETTTRQVMTQRRKIVAISDDWDETEILNTLTKEGYSRYPVYSDSIDNIIGILHTKDIINLIINKKKIIVKEIIRPTIFVKEDYFIDELLTLLQKNKIQMAVVNDDFGGTAGIVTMEDILEEIVGEIHDEHDEESKMIENISDNIIIVDASIQIRELNELLPEILPESDEYETIGGFIIYETENIPDENTEMTYNNYKFTILQRTKTRIEKVRIEYLSIDNES